MCVPKIGSLMCVDREILRIVYKKTGEWCIEEQRVPMNDNEWYNEWQRVTTSDNEWQWVIQRVTTSGTTRDNEWQRMTKWQRTTTSDNEWQRMLTSDNDWLFWLIFLFWNLSTCTLKRLFKH